MLKEATHPSLSRRRLLQATAATVALGMAAGVQAAQYPEINWDALVPSDWDPMKSFRDLQKLAELPDYDPRVQALYDRMRKVWDEAPTIASLEGRKVKIPGFVVPLDETEKGLTEFLLVPYFGACIHTPPPPANQIIHVHANPPVRGFKTMSAVWVSGTLAVGRGDSELGVSGYRLQAARVEQYREK
jgi:hypothetical protein